MLYFKNRVKSVLTFRRYTYMSLNMSLVRSSVILGGITIERVGGNFSWNAIVIVISVVTIIVLV